LQPNTETDDGITPLLSSVAAGSLPCLEVLIQVKHLVVLPCIELNPIHMLTKLLSSRQQFQNGGGTFQSCLYCCNNINYYKRTETLILFFTQLTKFFLLSDQYSAQHFSNDMQYRQVQTQMSGLVEQPHYMLLLIVEIQK
jgi:hypothetical protein